MKKKQLPKDPEVDITVNKNTGLKSYRIPWNYLDEVILKDHENDPFLFLKKISYTRWWLGIPGMSFDITIDKQREWKVEKQ